MFPRAFFYYVSPKGGKISLRKRDHITRMEDNSVKNTADAVFFARAICVAGATK